MGNYPSKSKPKSKHRSQAHPERGHQDHGREAGHGLDRSPPRSERFASVSSTESAASAASVTSLAGGSLGSSDSAASLSSRHRRHLTLAFVPVSAHAQSTEKPSLSANNNKLSFVDPSFCLDAAVSLHFKFARASTSPVPITYLGAFDDLTDNLPPFPHSPASVSPPVAATGESACSASQLWFTFHDHSGILSTARTLVDSQGTPICHYHNADVYRGAPPNMHARCLQVTATTTQRGGKISLVARPTDLTAGNHAFMLTLQAKERDDVKYIRASPLTDFASSIAQSTTATGHSRTRKRALSASSAASASPPSLSPIPSSPPPMLAVLSQSKRNSTSPKLAAKGARRGDPIVARIRRQLLPAPESAVARAKNIAYVVDVAPGVDVAAIAVVCMYVYAAEAKGRAKRSQSSVGQLVV
ncbi:hypothetical protein BCR44DRAFT_41218 [Catenaria anguillulae PL171]|uniref:Uncharacterized protein n=1 Tax=Catenaria anguillulae PL171 TaxID=765915 RepID=A0A1Y2HX68_9FUNG|nr:hypothetical protein BCR44DRAFT_41218 [Catenaria anguillulae PL171]